MRASKAMTGSPGTFFMQDMVVYSCLLYQKSLHSMPPSKLIAQAPPPPLGASDATSVY